MTANAGVRRLVVVKPVADLRRKPIGGPLMNVHDDLQETQLLFNELLLLTGEEEDWFRVETVEQRKSSGVGFPGWVRKKDVERQESPREYDGLVRRFYRRDEGTVTREPAAFSPVSRHARPFRGKCGERLRRDRAAPSRDGVGAEKGRHTTGESHGHGTGDRAGAGKDRPSFFGACPTSGAGAACPCHGRADRSRASIARAS